MYNLSRFLFKLTLLAWCYSLAVGVAIYWPQSGWVLLIVAVVIVKRRRGGRLTTLGSARWAEDDDLRRAGMLNARTGLCVGQLVSEVRGRKMRAIRGLFRRGISNKEACEEFVAAFKGGHQRPLVKLPRVIHTAIFSPSGGGKGVSFVVPFLLSSSDSCVVIDLKGENAKLTAKFRRKVFGQQQGLLDPYRMVTQTPDTLNPLDFIQKDDPHCLDRCADLAKALVIRTGEEKEPHFNDTAELFIWAAIVVVVFFGEAKDGTRSLQTVRDILTIPQKLEIATKLLLESTLCGGLLARIGGQLTHFLEKERGSTLTTAGRHLKFLDSQAVAESTSSSSLDINKLRTGELSVFLILPPDHMREKAPLLRMWIVLMFQTLVAGGLERKRLTHFILDECASIGHLEAIDDAVDKYRHYGIRCQFYFQSMGQLKKCFPDGQDQTLLSNTTQIFFGVNDGGLPGGSGTAEYVSSRLGEQTVIVTSGGTSAGTSKTWSSGGNQSSGGGSSSYNGSANWNQQVRKLLQPSEVVALSPRLAITFTPGVPPVLSYLQRYYEKGFLQNYPGRLRRSANACNALLTAAFLCALAVGLAVVATQREMEMQGVSQQPTWQFSEPSVVQEQQPAIGVAPWPSGNGSAARQGVAPGSHPAPRSFPLQHEDRKTQRSSTKRP